MMSIRGDDGIRTRTNSKPKHYQGRLAWFKTHRELYKNILLDLASPFGFYSESPSCFCDCLSL